MRELIGKTVSVTTVVTEDSTARAVGSGCLGVFATPMMLALMEQAACACLACTLAEGQTSVGTQANIAHTAASPIGAKITATAAITGVEGRRIDFAVSASDDAGEIGQGTHTRVIVDAEKIMLKADSRKAG